MGSGQACTKLLEVTAERGQRSLASLWVGCCVLSRKSDTGVAVASPPRFRPAAAYRAADSE